MSNSVKNSMLRTAGFMAAATMLAKLLGLMRDSFITAYFGLGIEADAFLTATRLPTNLFDIVIGGVISATFIPIFNDIMTKSGKAKAMEFANKFVTMILSAAVIISILGIVFADPLISVQVPEYGPDKHALTVLLTRIMFPMIIFTGLAFSYVGLLQSFGEYNIPSIISLVSNAVIILYFLLFGERFGVIGLSVTMVIAWSLQLIIQIPSLKKFGVKFRPDFRLRDNSIKQAITLAVPMLVSTWVQPLYSIINTRIASGTDGAVATLDIANRLYIIVVGVFSFVVTNLIFPKLSRANSEGGKDEAMNLVVTSLKAIILIIAPLMAGFIILSPCITRILYGYGQVTSSGVEGVAQALSCYSVGMVGLAVNEILSKAFFSMQNSKTPMKNSIISMVGNIVLAYTLYNTIGINGLALAAAGGSIINAVLNLICMMRRNKGMFKREDVSDIIKAAVSAAVMGIIVYFVYRALGGILPDTLIGTLITAAVCGVCGVIVYGVCCLILKIKLVTGLFKKNK